MIRTALAGAGAWGLNHVRALGSMRGVRLDWVVDPDPARREAAHAVAPQARVVADLGEALADARLDAVVVASPSPTHEPVARAALTAGKHVLVEKPLAPTAAEAWDLVARARKARRLLVVGHLLLYHPAVRRLAGLVRQGRVGRVLYLYGQRTNLGRLRDDEGALASLAPHDISVMVHLLGCWPQAVSAQGATYAQPRFEDLVFLTLRFPGKVLGHVHLSWLDPHKVRRISLVGARRMAVFDDMEPAAWLTLHDRTLSDPTLPGHGVRAPEGGGVVKVPLREPLREELAAFVHAIRTRTPSLTPGEDGARVVEVLEASQRSLERRGAPIDVDVR